MSVGPGKYDDVATLVREQTDGSLVVVIVMDGDRGHGFAVQTDSPAKLKLLPFMLRSMADDIEQDIKRDVQ